MFKQFTMLKEILTILILTIAIHDLKAQDKTSLKSISDSIEVVKTLMRKNGSVESYSIGNSGRQSNQFQRFVYLVNHLTTNEFIALSKDTSTCLRIYSYAGLKYKGYKYSSQIKSEKKNDSTLIPYMRGCGTGNVQTNVIVAELKKWCEKKTVMYALKQQNESSSFWYTNFVFRN